MLVSGRVSSLTLSCQVGFGSNGLCVKTSKGTTSHPTPRMTKSLCLSKIHQNTMSLETLKNQLDVKVPNWCERTTGSYHFGVLTYENYMYRYSIAAATYSYCHLKDNHFYEMMFMSKNCQTIGTWCSVDSHPEPIWETGGFSVVVYCSTFFNQIFKCLGNLGFLAVWKTHPRGKL